jgi:MYXO-CTERM domain-containing protein
MKTFGIASVALLFITGTLSMCGQGTFVYDQQSVTNDSNGGEGVPTIQLSQPVGQSFTPTLSSVGFVRFFLIDAAFNGLGATVIVNVRSDSITGPILGSTDPVFMPDGFGGRTNFVFSTPVALIPSSTYFLEPVVQSGDLWGIVDDPNYNYPGGTAFGGGQPAPPFDLWFREGIVVPEPSGIALALSGLAGFAALIRRHRNC